MLMLNFYQVLDISKIASSYKVRQNLEPSTSRQKIKMKTNCPVFHPSLEEFSDFEKYMEKVEAESAGFGMAKIVPPASWCARKKGYDKISAKVSHPIKQLVTGLTGSYQVYLISEPEMSYKSFKSYAQKRELPDNLSVDLVERMVNSN